jgi:cephalosporin hydroxylase/glycosyltransferase involved in cell wall biosynthesis
LIAPDAALVSLPAAIVTAGMDGHVDRFGPAVIDGWITDQAQPSRHPAFQIIEDGVVVGTVVADRWRVDLQETRQGDGRWGFTALPPAALADGIDHVVTLVLPDGRALLRGPIRVRFDPGADRGSVPELRPPAFEPDPAGRSRPGNAPVADGGGLLLSVIVAFFNMKREAARTLTSLSRAYQRGAEQIGYEVICIDNGSAEPLEPDWIESFGAEFRLIRADRAHPSPIALINEAARHARGHYVAVMIDGAHVLSPGVFREAAEAIAEAPGAAIGLRQWFVGGDQRFLSRSGWTRQQEDMLFDRILWPRNGYDLFRISTPVWESPNHWFDGMSETNCLFLPRELFLGIGGFDAAFDEPAAGYANLDLFRRAFEATAEPPVVLIGEASFHQFHGGTTTNVDDDEKERKVRGYAFKYFCLRGKPWQPIDPSSLRFRGQVRTRSALVARQRPLSPAKIGVTTALRDAQMTTHLDEGAADYLVSVYAEARLHEQVMWRGQSLGVAPADALAIAAILHDGAPSRIVAVNLAPGLLSMLRDVIALGGMPCRLITVGAPEDHHPLAAGTLARVRHGLGAASDVLVLYGCRKRGENLLAALHAYSEFVSLRSYLVVVGSAFGQPWLGYARAWTMNAINSFVGAAPFAIDHARTAHLVTTCPLGFLQRIGPVETTGDCLAVALAAAS